MTTAREADEKEAERIKCQLKQVLLDANKSGKMLQVLQEKLACSFGFVVSQKSQNLSSTSARPPELLRRMLNAARWAPKDHYRARGGRKAALSLAGSAAERQRIRPDAPGS